MIGSVWITADGGRESGRITAERRSIRRTAGRRQEHGRRVGRTIGSVWITADGRRRGGRAGGLRRRGGVYGGRQVGRQSTAEECRADDRVGGVDHGRRQAGERADYGREAEYTADGRSTAGEYGR